MTDRIKVQPVRAANGRIQGWAINRGNRELAFVSAIGWKPHRHAMIVAQRIARGETR